MTSLGEASGPRPSRLGRYELITQIGQGGMAEVQLAIQRGPAGFEKLVVVKLVHANLATQKSFVDMLLDEARMAALVKHPNVVDIYDLGEAEGRYFIAMEYLEGEPLLAVLRAGREGKRLDPLSTGRLISDTAEGLDAAHELRTMAGEPIELVHHDVSLGNIVILYNGQVKLVDFGVAKATSAAGPRAKVHGKFSYMAPEKLQGGSGDRRSDIWSLGCVLWEALTLRRLFKGGNDADTMKQVLETKIPRPSAVNGDVPKDFDAIVMKALERSPADRYSTAKEMAHDLEEVLREHRYGSRNDVIARYMQATFESHLTARKKLLQEVSSKGRASQDILEAAFTDQELASGSPVTNSGEFSVKFNRPSAEMAAAEDPSRPPARSRSAHPSGQLLSQPYEEAAPPAATAGRIPRRTAVLAVLATAGIVVTAIVIIAIFRGGPKVVTRSAHGTTGSASAIGFAVRSAAGSADEEAAGSGSDTLAASGSGEEEVEIEMIPPAPGSAQTPTVRPPKVNPQELFKVGMKAYVKGDSRAAVTSFRRAVQAQPGYATAWRALGLAHEKLGEWGQAKTALQRYLQLAPKASDATQIRARIGTL